VDYHYLLGDGRLRLQAVKRLIVEGYARLVKRDGILVFKIASQNED